MREQTLLNWVLLSENEKTANGKECLCKPVHVPTAVCVPDRDPVRAKQNSSHDSSLKTFFWFCPGQWGSQACAWVRLIIRVLLAHNPFSYTPSDFAHALGSRARRNNVTVPFTRPGPKVGEREQECREHET